MCINRKHTCQTTTLKRNDCDLNYSESAICKIEIEPSLASAEIPGNLKITDSQN